MNRNFQVIGLLWSCLVSLILKVGSHDLISIQLTLKIFVCVMEFVGVYTIQFLHPIIS